MNPAAFLPTAAAEPDGREVLVTNPLGRPFIDAGARR